MSLLFAVAMVLQSCNNTKDQRNGKDDRPNIIFIMSDDHAANAISCYGNSVNKTPNIDRLADEGMRFDQSFCTNAICAPSRAVVLTGKYSHLNGVVDNTQKFDGSQETFPKILRNNDYQTAMIGKWHLKSAPTGFDYWNILRGQGNYYNPGFIEMGENKKYEGYVTDIITQLTLDWLDERDTTRPFCLMMHHKAPHRTWMPDIDHINDFDSTDIPVPFNYFDDYKNRSTAAKAQKMSVWKDMYLGYDLKLTTGFDSTQVVNDLSTRAFDRMTPQQRRAWDSAYRNKNNDFYRKNPEGKALARWKFRRYQEDYLGTIQSVDESVGTVLDYLDRHGLSENTIVVYTSDQGFFLGEHGWFDKRFMYEESLKIPLLVRYPREVKKGSVSNDMVLNLDFAPTFLDFAGISVPGEMQGKSFKDILAGKTPGDWRDAIYYHYYEYPCEHFVKRHYGIRTHDFKLIHYYYDIDEWELFDLKNDPHEMKNVYNDPAYSEKVIQLKKQLKELRREYRDDGADQFLPGKAFETIGHIAVGKPVSLEYPFSRKYPGGGNNALTDGRMASKELTKTKDLGVWQGFEENDMIATIDLQHNTDIKSISAGFLQDIDSWIFSPVWVEFAVSDDNKTFTVLKKINRKIAEDLSGKERVVFMTDCENVRARYVRVHAKNIGHCPAWHKGAGGKAWLFADEIIVR